MSNRLRSPTIAMICFTLVSVWAMHLELRAFSGANSIARAGQPGLTITPDIGLSNRSIQLALRNCDVELLPSVSAFRTSRHRLATAQICSSIAYGALQKIPTHGFAHYISAASERELGNLSESLRSFRKSIKYAPFEGWIAERRFVHAVNSGDTEVMDVLQPDLATLLSTQSGAELLAIYYGHPSDLPPRINRAFMSASPAQEQRFINLLRRKLSSG
ncbi:MAG: hypothetical protein KUG58_08160 [Marinosulfonomonas sp.]|nr:hypothetical protein [Marinosulfonomonas sp.]